MHGGQIEPKHELTPELASKLEGPEVGALVEVASPYGWLNGRVARVLHRSYVWAPDRQNNDGTYGYRHYDWSVIQYGPGKTLVVDDYQLTVLTPGMVITLND